MARMTATMTRARSTAVALPALLVLLAASFVALSVLAGWTKEMHGPGGPSFGTQQGLTGGAETARTAVGSWLAFDRQDSADLYVGPEGAVAAFFVVDALLFVPAYLLTGVLVLRRGGAVVAGFRPPERRARARDLFRWGERALWGTAAFDQLENLLGWLVFRGYWPDGTGPVDPGGGAQALAAVAQGVAFAKWLLAAVVLVVVLVLALVWAQRRRTEAATTLRLVRVQAVGLGVLTVALFMPMQVPDTILTWDLAQFLAVLLLSVLLAVTQWALTRHVLDRAATVESRRPGANVPVPGRFYGAAAGVLAGLAVVAFGTGLVHEKVASTALLDAVSGAGSLAGIALVVLGLSWLVRGWAEDVQPADEPEDLMGAVVVPRVLAAAVPMVVGLSTLRVSLNTFAIHRHQNEWPRVLGAVVLMAAGVALYAAFRVLEALLTRDGPGTSWWRGRRWRLSMLAGALGLAVALASVAWPFSVPLVLSAAGVMLTFLVVLTFVAGLLVVAAEWASTRYYLPAVFRLFRVRRLPVFVVVLVWATLASSFDSGAHWEVRRLDGQSQTRPLTFEDMWNAWLAANATGPAEVPDPTVPGQRRAVPLLVVAASGGGIRAATWTSLALRCLFEGQGGGACATDAAPDASNVFLASGVSGGSLGLAEFVAHLDAGQPAATDWVTEHVRGDYVSPQLAWQLLVEAPRSLLHFGADDRAEILERSWERSWDGVPGSPLERGLVDVQDDHLGRVPVLLMNGSSVYDGCWILSSALREAWQPDARQGPGTCLAYDRFPGAEPDPAVQATGSLPAGVDVTRFLCTGEDLRLSTAALLSARFPLVSPAGRLSTCGNADRGGTRDTKYVLDGGDIEASAAENAVAAWTALEDRVAARNARAGVPCVVPFFVQVDNGYVESVEPGAVRPPNQLSAPLTSVLSGRDARPQRSRAESLVEFTKPLPGLTVTADGAPLLDRYAHLVPIGHPGTEPTLGWALSEQSQEDLRDQLRSAAAARVVDEIQGWLTADLRCSAG